MDSRLGDIVAFLLGIETKEFIRIITCKTRMLGRGEAIDSPLNRIECINGVQAIARELYERIFNWLVERLNLTI